MLQLEVGSLPTTSNSTSSGKKVIDVLPVAQAAILCYINHPNLAAL